MHSARVQDSRVTGKVGRPVLVKIRLRGIKNILDMYIFNNKGLTYILSPPIGAKVTNTRHLLK